MRIATVLEKGDWTAVERALMRDNNLSRSVNNGRTMAEKRRECHALFGRHADVGVLGRQGGRRPFPGHTTDGTPALLEALRMRDQTSVNLLLEYGARIRSKDRTGRPIFDEFPSIGTRAHPLRALPQHCRPLGHGWLTSASPPRGRRRRRTLVQVSSKPRWWTLP